MLVLRTACIMFDVVEPATIDLYIARVERYHIRYGATFWALLYQTESRMRRERFTRILQRGSCQELMRQQTTADSSLNKKPPLDPEKPWEYCFFVAAEFEKDYWYEEFVEVVQSVRNDPRAVARHLGTDAPIAASSSQPPLDDDYRVPLRSAGQDRGRGRERERSRRRARTGASRVHRVGDDGLYSHNRQDGELCKGFQNGTCKIVRGQIRCPKDWSKFHQCGKCLSETHGAYKCSSESKPSDAKPEEDKKIIKFHPRGGRGGGRGQRRR